MPRAQEAVTALAEYPNPYGLPVPFDVMALTVGEVFEHALGRGLDPCQILNGVISTGIEATHGMD